MEVVCIDNERGWWKNITIGKVYDVLIIRNDSYEIYNDNKNNISYSKDLFKTIPEIRNEKIERLLK